MTVRLVARSVWENPGNRGARLGRSVAAVRWQVEKRLLGRSRVLTLASGARFRAYPDCVVSSSLIYAEWPEFPEIMFLRSRLREGQTVVDVGANVGHLGLLLSDVVGWRSIVALEPTPVSFRRLTENWELNGWETEGLVRAAAGSRSGVTFVPDSAAPVTTNATSEVAGAESTSVPLLALDDMRQLWDEREIGLLKIDVEGGEARVFEGAVELLRRRRPRTVMFESLAGRLDPTIADVLRDTGYTPFALDSAGRPSRSGLGAQNLFAVPEVH